MQRQRPPRSPAIKITITFIITSIIIIVTWGGHLRHPPPQLAGTTQLKSQLAMSGDLIMSGRSNFTAFSHPFLQRCLKILRLLFRFFELINTTNINIQLETCLNDLILCYVSKLPLENVCLFIYNVHSPVHRYFFVFLFEIFFSSFFDENVS